MDDALVNLPRTASPAAVRSTHGAAIGALVQRFTGRPEPFAWGDSDVGAWGFRFANCSIARLHLSPGFATLYVLNDHAHLETLRAAEGPA